MIESTEFPLEIIFKSTLRASCDEVMMMLESMGISSEMQWFEGYYAIFVQKEDVSRAAEQLRLYNFENRNRPRPALPFVVVSNGYFGALVYSFLLILFFELQYFGIYDLSITDIGRSHAGAIQAGQWWRVITALFLHSDIAHLVGNIFFGALFGVFVSQSLGSGIAWFAILVAGAMGNMVSAFIKASHFSAIGASTATFAALGILSAYAWQHRKYRASSRFRRWLPIIAGLALLAFLGGPGERIDVLSHVTGFISGVLLGTALGVLRDHLLLTMKVQVICGIATLSLIALAWLMAVMNAV